MTLKEYQIIGRKTPTGADPKPPIYRMRIFAPNSIVVKSRFWYFLGQLHKIKRSHGEILAVNQIYERKPLKVKNFGIFLRYNSRGGTHNVYKEFRDLTRAGAVNKLYMDMAARHRTAFRSIQILDVKEIPASKTRRPSTQQFHDSGIKFPLPHRHLRVPLKRFHRRFRPVRPNTYY
eukprot:TRINITY_DN8822_c0_g1_i1.p1 TRINITY_DN8822_c0_g1~~TRINITY_DN8822_c0_g1_i1.p1  ORF type:complete len:192 (+),score=57.77 TRINITY_DN8822_c0_g1_i1:50-577(+)